MTKILVGTLHCGENEYDACCDSIRAQTNSDWEQFAIADKPNKLAHELLYQTFMNRASEFDFFIKVDADMVLSRPTFFEEAAGWMDSHTEVDNLQIAVRDFFSNRLIGGLHVFRSNVRWKPDDEGVFVDQCPVPLNRRHTDFKLLAPAADHCPNPSAFQSFHFGMHKGVKLTEAMRRGRSEIRQFAAHLANIEYTFRHYRRRRLRVLGLACVGAELAIQGRLGIANVDYANPETKKQLQSFERLSDSELWSEVKRLRHTSADRLGNRAWLLLRHGTERWLVQFLVAAKRNATSVRRVLISQASVDGRRN